MPGQYAKYPASTGGGGSGTVTSVGFTAPGIFTVSGSPVTTSGTIALGLAPEPANTVFAGPTTGGPATPTFRPLVVGDIPALPYALDSFVIMQTPLGTSPTASSASDTLTWANTDGRITITGNSLTKTITLNTTGLQPTGNYITALTGDVTASGPGSVVATLATVNSNVGSFTNASITVNGKGLVTAASSGTAPVTSVSASAPLQSSGGTTPTISFPNETANTVLAGPTTGGAAQPTFRAIVQADLPGATVVTKTANYTLVAGDRGTRLLANTNGGAFTLTLLSAATAGSGYSFYLIDKVGTFQTNNLSLTPNGTDKISGINTTKIFQTNWGGWYIFTDGTDWYVV